MTFKITKNQSYHNYIIFIAALMNSIAGLAIALYAPSLPSIGKEFAVSEVVMQNTVSTTLIAYAFGQIFFGVMSDYMGRKKTIICGLLLFIFASILAAYANNIGMLLIARALQGFSIGACQVVSRAILVDSITGERFFLAITYLSIAFSVAPVISPFVGGYIDAFLGWRYNFVLYAIYSLIIFLFVIFGLKESLNPAHKKNPVESFSGAKLMLTCKDFIAGVLVLATSFSTSIVWNIVGPFIIQDSILFGKTALLVGAGYLAGNLLNRLLLKSYTSKSLVKTGITLYILSLIIIYSKYQQLNIKTLIVGITIISFAQGFIFANTMAKCMSLFVDRAGLSASLQGSLMLLFGSVVSFFVSNVSITSNYHLGHIFLLLFLIQKFSLYIMMHGKTHKFV